MSEDTQSCASLPSAALRDPTQPFKSADLTYINKCDSNFVCLVCLCPALDPLMCKACEHVFCSLSAHLPCCPACGVEWGAAEALAPVPRFILNMLDNLLVACPHSCKQQLARGTLQAHLRFCPLLCSGCGDQVLANDHSYHITAVCPAASVGCTLNCGVSLMPRRDLPSHEAVCPAEVPCMAADVGCQATAPRHSLSVHHSSCQFVGLHPVLRAVHAGYQRQIAALKDEHQQQLAAQQQQLLAMQQQISSLIAVNFNAAGFSKEGIHLSTGSRYNPQGRDADGFDVEGRDADGYDRRGFGSDGFGRDGLDSEGRDRAGRLTSGPDDLLLMPAALCDTRTSVAVAEMVSGSLLVVSGTVAQLFRQKAWETLPPVPASFDRFSKAAVLHDQVYLFDRRGTAAVCFENNTWIRLPPLPASHGLGGAAALDGRLYVCGHEPPSAEVVCFDPASRSWVSSPPMPMAHGYSAVAALEGSLYVVGGVADRVLGTCFCFSPTTNSWSQKAPLPQPRLSCTAVAHSGLLYVMGGSDGSTPHRADCWSYNPKTDTWTALAPMPRKHGTDARAFVLRGCIMVVGGDIHPLPRYIECYNPATNSWRP